VIGPAYRYAARLVRVIDGDTAVMDVDLGFDVWIRQSCRLAGINARELHDEGGPEAAAHLSFLLDLGGPLVVESVARDKFAGRFDGRVILTDEGIDVGASMVADGYAAEWSGAGARPVPPWPLSSRGMIGT
jgi:endonuclease YncB( thermonuclease family)